MQVPLDISSIIFSYHDYRDLGRLRRTCKFWYKHEKLTAIIVACRTWLAQRAPIINIYDLLVRGSKDCFDFSGLTEGDILYCEGGDKEFQIFNGTRAVNPGSYKPTIKLEEKPPKYWESLGKPRYVQPIIPLEKYYWTVFYNYQKVYNPEDKVEKYLVDLPLTRRVSI